MVAAATVNRSSGGIACEPLGKGCRLDLLVQLERGIERTFGGAIRHQLDRPEQAASADVADMTVIAETFGKPLLELPAALLDPIEQIVVADDVLHLERGGAGQRMAKIGMAVLERAGATADSLDDLTARQHGADRLGTA